MSANDAPKQQLSQPITFEFEQPDRYGQYMLSASLDVLFILRSLLKRGCMATVYFDEGRSFFLTWLLGIGADEHSIVLDMGGDPAVNREAVKAERLIFTANLDSVKIQFAVNGLRETAFNSKPAFVAAVPNKVLRLQRREYFRLETPLVNPVRCQVPAPRQDGSVHTLDLIILDISGGGLSLMAPTDTADSFKTGTLLTDCRLQIPEENVILTSLCVRSAFPVLGKSGQEYLRIGCEYVNLPGARLNMIQRYITRIERQRKARETGLD
jgi:flagellar brake protein